jgi:hypothetical protein
MTDSWLEPGQLCFANKHKFKQSPEADFVRQQPQEFPVTGHDDLAESAIENSRIIRRYSKMNCETL